MGNYSNTSSDTESEDQPKKKRRLSSSPIKSDVDDMDSNKNSETPMSVKPVVKPSVKPSVKQSVTQNMTNEKESFTPTPTSPMRTQCNGKKIIITPVNSPITQIKGGIKKIKPHKRKFFSSISQMRKRNGEQK